MPLFSCVCLWLLWLNGIGNVLLSGHYLVLSYSKKEKVLFLKKKKKKEMD